MTITVGTLKAGPFTPTGVEQVLPFPFMVFDDTLVEVYQLLDGVKTVLLEGSYTVDRNVAPNGQPQEGGDITITANPDLGDLYVRGTPSKGQGQQWSNSGSRLDSLNSALDRLTQRDLEIEGRQDELDASKLDRPDDASAGYLVIDADGNVTSSEGTGPDGSLRSDLGAQNGGTLVGTPFAGTSVNTMLKGLGGAPAIIQGRFFLTNVMSAAEITDVATQTGAIDLSAKLNALVAEAEGREIYLPQGGLVNLSGGGIVYEPDYAITGQKYAGLKIFGDSGTTLRGPAGGFAIDIDTGVSFKFQDRIYLCGFDIDCAGQAGAQGIRAKRAYRALIENMNINAPRGDGVFIQVPSNDADSSNNWEIVRLNVTDASGWAFHHQPFPGQNDLSYLYMRACLFNSCGRDERKGITGITKASPAAVSCVAHGFVDGTRIQIGGAKGMFEANISRIPFYVKGTGANSFTLYRDVALTQPVDSSGWGTWTSGGYAFPAVASSGAINMSPQESRLVQVACTETRNVAFQIGLPTSQSLQTVLDQCTAENTTGRSVSVLAASGLDMRRTDLRTNSTVAETYAHVVLDGTDRSVEGVKIEGGQLAAVNGSSPIVTDIPIVAFQGIGPNLLTVDIDASACLYAFGTTNQTVFGDGLFGASGLRLVSPTGGAIIEPGGALTTTYTTANPSYTPDIRKGRKHIVVLGAGSSGTLTVTAPAVGDLAGGGPLQGAELEIIIVNNSGGLVNLTWSIATKSAPTTVASADTKSGQWRYSNAVGWVQSSAWI